MGYYLKRGKTVQFRMKKNPRSPTLSGVVQTSSRKVVWVTMNQETEGKKKEVTICIPKRNVI